MNMNKALLIILSLYSFSSTCDVNILYFSSPERPSEVETHHPKLPETSKQTTAEKSREQVMETILLLRCILYKYLFMDVL